MGCKCIISYGMLCIDWELDLYLDANKIKKLRKDPDWAALMMILLNWIKNVGWYDEDDEDDYKNKRRK